MTIDDRDTVALCADAHRTGFVQIKGRVILFEAAEDLACLPLNFLFFSANIWHNIVKHI